MVSMQLGQQMEPMQELFFTEMENFLLLTFVGLLNQMIRKNY